MMQIPVTRRQSLRLGFADLFWQRIGSRHLFTEGLQIPRANQQSSAPAFQDLCRIEAVNRQIGNRTRSRAVGQAGPQCLSDVLDQKNSFFTAPMCQGVQIRGLTEEIDENDSTGVRSPAFL